MQMMKGINANEKHSFLSSRWRNYVPGNHVDHGGAAMNTLAWLLLVLFILLVVLRDAPW